MASHKKNASESRPRYVVLLETLQTLQQNAKATLYDRVAAGVELFDNPGYREKLRAGTSDGVIDDAMVADAINGFFADVLGFSFLRLRTIYQVINDRKAWLDAKSLDDLYDAAMEHRPTAGTDVPKTPRRSVKVDDFDAMAAKVEELAAINREIKRENKAGMGLVDQLRAENAELRARIDELERENAELKRALLEPTTVAA